MNLDIEQPQEMDVLRCRIILATYICLIGTVGWNAGMPQRDATMSQGPTNGKQNYVIKLAYGRKNMSSNWHLQMYVGLLISLGKPQALC